MGAVLLDRAGRYDLPLLTIRSLADLPATLGLSPPPAPRS
jgi:hypothetical protein